MYTQYYISVNERNREGNGRFNLFFFKFLLLFTRLPFIYNRIRDSASSLTPYFLSVLKMDEYNIKCSNEVATIKAQSPLVLHMKKK